jgi:hypothetical protein
MMDSMNFDKTNLRGFMDDHNPEATRGSAKSAPAHEDVPSLDIQKHLRHTNPMLHQKIYGASEAAGDQPPAIPSEAMDDKAKSRAALANIRAPKAPGAV